MDGNEYLEDSADRILIAGVSEVTRDQSYQDFKA